MCNLELTISPHRWPVIAIIVVGSLIILSIVMCIVRCCCLGKACCCSCFSCFKCCGNCCGCCDTPGDRKHKYLDEPYIPPHQGYRTEAPMQPFAPIVGPSSGPPQYAEFDMAKKGGEDSLPQMPSWEGSNSKKIALEEEESHEMNNLNKQTTGITDQPTPLGGPSAIPAAIPAAGLHNGRSQSPFGRPEGSPAGGPMRGGPMGAGGHPRDQYAMNNQQPGYGNPDGQPGDYGLDQPYDLPPAGMAPMAGGRNSPAPSYRTNGPNRMNGGYVDMPQANDYGSRDAHNPEPQPGPGYGMHRQNTGEAPYGSRGASPGPGQLAGYRGAYGPDPTMRNSPGPRSPGPRQSPRPHGDPYGRPPRGSPGPGGPGYGRQPYSPTRDNFNRTQSPGPDRQYAQSPRPLQRPPVESPLAQHQDPPQSPIVNNSGFDFNSGFSRPQTSDGGYDRRPSESREAPSNEGYPGYKPYRPAQEGWSGV